MSNSAIIVISDLHMGSGLVDDFEPSIEKHFVDFLAEWRSRSAATDLVINGDLFDFVQAPPYKGRDLESVAADGTPLCFTEEQSLAKLEAIHKDHVESIHALGEFLTYRTENRIVLLPGNHDADFYWKRVRKRFSDLMCGDDASAAERLVFWLDSVYRPKLCQGVWIEHGHQHDPVNRFFIDGEPRWSDERPPIQKDRHGEERLLECIGTRFLIQFLNDLDVDYPYVDNVKPFSRFLQLFGASALRPGLGPLKATIAVAAMEAFLAKNLISHPKDILEFDELKPSSAASLLLAIYQGITKARREMFVKGILERGYALDRSPEILLADEESAAPLLLFLSQNMDLLDSIDHGPSEGKLDLTASFFVRETDELRSRAANILKDREESAQTVIMGHTHETLNERTYLNTGSWTRYYKVGKKERLRPWAILRKSSWKEFPYSLNFALVVPGGTPLASLETYAKEGANSDA